MIYLDTISGVFCGINGIINIRSSLGISGVYLHVSLGVIWYIKTKLGYYRGLYGVLLGFITYIRLYRFCGVSIGFI